MNRPRLLLPCVLAAGGALAAWAMLRTPAPAPVPPAPPVHAGPRGTGTADPSGESAAAPPFWTRRVGAEALLLAEPGAAVEFLDGTGRVLSTGRTDPGGAFRGTIPAGAGSLTLRFAAGTTAVWRLPESAAPVAVLLLDRPVLRPGDRVRACGRAETDAPPPVLSSGPGGDRVEFSPVDPEAPPAPWCTFEAAIPDDLSPGIAAVAFADRVVEVFIAGRFPSAAAPDATPVSTESTTGGLRLARGDGRWTAEGPADAGTILFYAESGGRLLTHQAVAAIDGIAATPLPLGDAAPARVRVVAVASTPRGFLETAVGDSGPAAPPLDDDPVLSRFLAERPIPGEAPPAPAWIHEGDEPAGPGPFPPARQGYLARDGSASARPGAEAAVAPPAGALVRWVARPPEAEGALRISGGGAILVEARVGPGRTGGSFRAPDPAPRTLLVESGAPGLEAVDFGWTVEGRAEAAPAAPGRFLSLERALADREYRVVIRWRERPGVTEVVCPIPRGADLDEDGWAIRSRAPAGTRVATPDGAVVFRVSPGEPGEAALSFRIRPARPGRWAAPAASARCGDDAARSAAGYLEIP